jgi:HD-GYP domain-containing protein (c-di-GMP phosphodiesterase class II)
MKIRIEKPLLKSLAMMASVIEARDAYTGGHLYRVSQYCRYLAEAAGLPRNMVFLARLGGFLHDIGKVGIPDGILGKRGALSLSEFEIIKTHPGIGASLVQVHPLGELALLAIHQHHEWVNGMGYPDCLQGDEISVYAKIVSIADAFDALTSTRPYRLETSPDPAVATLLLERGTQFDPSLLDAFVKMVQREALTPVVGHSEPGRPMVACPNCGPVIPVDAETADGGTIFCRVCGTRHLLHRKGDTFEVEPTDEKGSAEQLKPRPEMNALETLVSDAPRSVKL